MVLLVLTLLQILGQSLGEPTTQMTLKAFHSSGIAGMNVSSGVPRVKEIINAVKNTATPVIRATLEAGALPLTKELAKIVQGRVERTYLRDVMAYMELVLSPESCYILVKLDLLQIRKLFLEVDVESVAKSIMEKCGKLKLKRNNVTIVDKSLLKITPPTAAKSSTFFLLQQLKVDLPMVVVRGVALINKAWLQTHEKDDVSLGIKATKERPVFTLAAEGDNLLHVMGIRGLQGIPVL